jgi:hypothetical protein
VIQAPDRGYKYDKIHKEAERVANPFAIQKSQQDDLSVINVEGFLDALTAPEFEHAIQSEIDADRG